ncbi:Protein transport protein isoform 1 [Schistosoma japonicum]|uniref:Protein transport protein isoform 1 n=2 Tax=Schistosoma japonicum TaxID=6182 RepID=A0A4Z2DDC3_SCHJA|nr:Protein transport protein isoform 1 [Schistosoma japonicum]
MLHNQNGQSLYNHQPFQQDKGFGYPNVSNQHVYGAANSSMTDAYPHGFPDSNYQQPPNYYPGGQEQMVQPQTQSHYSSHPMQHVNQPLLPPMPPAANNQDFTPRPQQPLLPPMPPMPPGPSGVRSPSYPPPQSANRFPLPNAAGSQMHTLQSQPAYQNGPVSRQPQFSQNINADGLPSAIEVMESNRNQCTGPFYTGQRGVVPPLVTTDFVTRDQGSCAPRFVRSSLYSVPTTSDLLKTVGIPFSLTISPFAVQHTEDMNIVISDMGPQGPVRCIRCKAYMNPFMNFIDGGRRFQCPLCNGLTEVGAEYFAHLDHTGRRVDAGQRPELCLGSYELLATTEYCKNNQLPLAPAIIFLIDVSQSAIRSGLVQLFCSRFVEFILPNLPRENFASQDMPNPIRVGFITYDHQLHFYTLPRESTPQTDPTNQNSYNSYGKPQMHIVADIEDVFVPAVEGFLIPPDPVIISSILEMIPSQFCTENALSRQPTDGVLGPAIQAGVEALRAANRSGKLFVMHANLPVGEAPGKLKNRDDRRLIGTEKEKSLLLPDNDFYVGLGQTCVEVGCSVDLFLFPNSYIDIASLAEVPRLTSGHLFKYNCFQADLQGHQFLADLQRTLSNLRAFNAVMRVRTSTGVRPVEFYGNCYLPNTTDVELASVSADMAITTELRHDDKLQEGELVFVQVACLFTSLSGQRRLRIHNLSIPVTSMIPDVFRLVELDAHMNWLSKYSMRSLLSRTHLQVMDDLTTRAANTLAAYRRHCTGGPNDVNSSPGELVLPQNMKLYPLYIQCLMKTEAFSPADGITIDDRCWQMFLVNQMDVKQSNCYIYPHLYPIHDLSLNFEGNIPYPPAAIRCSYDRLQMNAAYLLDNGIYLILWIGPNVSFEWIQAVFNVQNPKHFESEKIYDLCNFDNDTSRNLCTLLRKIRENHWHYSRLLVVRPGDKSELWFRRFMVEDRCSGNSISYTEYLCHIHKEVSGLLR